jgi:hypothetical protein
VGINSTDKACLVVFDLSPLKADPSFIVAGTIDFLVTSHEVILGGRVVFPFLWLCFFGQIGYLFVALG